MKKKLNNKASGCTYKPDYDEFSTPRASAMSQKKPRAKSAISEKEKSRFKIFKIKLMPEA